VKIARLTTSGFRGLPDRTFELADSGGAPHALVVVTGPPASGKTSFLDAIAAAKEDIGPYGAPRSPDEYLRPGAPAAKLTVDWVLDAEERSRLGMPDRPATSESILGGRLGLRGPSDPYLAALLKSYDHDPAHGKLEYFHDGRTLSPEATGPSGTDADDQRGLRLGKSLRKYAAIPRFLLEVGLGVDDRLGTAEEGVAKIAAAFASLCRTKRFAGLTRSAGRRVPVFQGAGDGLLELGALSSSELDALIFAATSLLIGLDHSVVLVDSPELHLGSAAVVPFVIALTKLGADNQLIVATGSKELAASAPAAAVIRLGPQGA
jgi:hypothetical protein